MSKERRHKRRESPERETKVKIKQERLSPVRPQRTRRSRSRSSGSSSPPRRRTSRSDAKLRPPLAAGLPDTEEAAVHTERDVQRSGDERRRKNDPAEERRSKWETDRSRDRGREGDRRGDRDAFASQQAERQQHDERRREHRQRREENQEHEFGETGETEENSEGSAPVDKEKPNFELSGALTEDTNTFRGVVIKYNEPPEARIPKRRWRLYPFKNDEPLPVMYIHRQSAYLMGRMRRIADIPIDHPSCSKQHAVFQYRLVEYTRADGTSGRRVRPYIIDLGSGNGTYLNNQRIEPQRFYELKEKDVLKFGFSSREYVLLHEFSDTSEVDSQQREEEDEDEGDRGPTG
uniref:FHA domain-containing protein n=1 Tax=Periophthalmus magnuspinnatus TaxID=409849 RepID=A0A3B3ZDM3_9GOBI